jgi:hypothetical protein
MVGAGGLIIMWHKNTIQIFFPDSTISEEYSGASNGESNTDNTG